MRYKFTRNIGETNLDEAFADDGGSRSDYLKIITAEMKVPSLSVLSSRISYMAWLGLHSIQSYFLHSLREDLSRLRVSGICSIRFLIPRRIVWSKMRVNMVRTVK
jgi:hypothetical protein